MNQSKLEICITKTQMTKMYENMFLWIMSEIHSSYSYFLTTVDVNL